MEEDEKVFFIICETESCNNDVVMFRPVKSDWLKDVSKRDCSTGDVLYEDKDALE